MANHPVITHVEQLSPSRLTALLRDQGALQTGAVQRVQERQRSASHVASHHKLVLDYTDDAAGAWLPRTLFLKLSNPEFLHSNELEVIFYTRLVPLMEQVGGNEAWPFARCLDAAWDAERHCSHLLLEDLSPTHVTKESNIPPERPLCEQLMDVYARFHAFWWEHPALGLDAEVDSVWQEDQIYGIRVGKFLTDADIAGFEADVNARLARLVDTYHTDLTPEQFRLLQQAVAKWPPRRRERVVRGRGVTLVHRDPHPGNIFYARNSATHTLKLVDWQSWRIDTGTDDLAYLMAFHWSATVRAAWEEPLLRRYHQQLRERGVQTYTWEDCVYDYRASIVRFLSIMTMYWQHPFNRDRLKLGLQAFLDWNCADIL